MNVHRVASAILNDLKSGLQAYSASLSLSIELLEDEVVLERLLVIRELQLKNQLPVKDLIMSLNCIQTDCLSLDKCCNVSDFSKPITHFEIPQFVDGTMDFIGSTDRNIKFKLYTSPSALKTHKYRIRKSIKPYVFIDMNPNKNGYLDGFIFGDGTNLLERLTVSAVWKDERQLEEFSCCSQQDIENQNALTNEIQRRLTEKKFRWYRQYYQTETPNDQVAK